MFLRSFTGFKDALKAGQISLVATSNFSFASSRIVSRQGYFIPKPPKSHHNSLFILQRILKQENIDYTKQQLEDKKFAPVEKQQAQEMFLAEKAAYEKVKKEYLQKYEFPKRRLQPIAFYVQKQMKNRGTATVSEWMKKICADYKNLSEEEKQEYKLLSEKDEERYQREKEEYAQRNSDLKIPEISKTQGYNLFVEEIAKKEGKEFKMQLAAKEWNKLTKKRQDSYTTKANEIAAEREKQLQQFIQKLDLNEEDVWILKKGFREDYELKEIEEKKLEKIKEEKEEEKDKIKRKKEAELLREKKEIKLEKQREKKATLREILAEKREKNKEKEQLKKQREKQNKLVQKEKDQKKKLLEKVRLVKQKELQKKREKRQKLIDEKKESLQKGIPLKKKKKLNLTKSEPVKKERKYTEAEKLESIFIGYPDKR